MLGVIFSIIAGAAMSVQGVMNTRLGQGIGTLEANALVQGTAFARPALGWSDTAGFDGKVVGGHENNTNDRAILQEFQDQTSNLLDRRAKKRVF